MSLKYNAFKSWSHPFITWNLNFSTCFHVRLIMHGSGTAELSTRSWASNAKSYGRLQTVNMMKSLWDLKYTKEVDKEFLFGAQQRLKREVRRRCRGEEHLIEMADEGEERVRHLQREMIPSHFQCLIVDHCQFCLLANVDGKGCNVCRDVKIAPLTAERLGKADWRKKTTSTLYHLNCLQ